MVGSVFFVEGILKFLYPQELAAGRFEKIRIPLPQVAGPFVGGVETVCGALGTVARYGLNGLISARVDTFPLGTMVVNVTGCFTIGFIAAISDPSFGRAWLKTEWRDFVMVGLCGGYTTFSNYGLQTLNLALDSEWLHVALNIVGSNALGLIAVYLGLVSGRVLQGGR